MPAPSRIPRPRVNRRRRRLEEPGRSPARSTPPIRAQGSVWADQCAGTSGRASTLGSGHTRPHIPALREKHRVLSPAPRIESLPRADAATASARRPDARTLTSPSGSIRGVSGGWSRRTPPGRCGPHAARVIWDHPLRSMRWARRGCGGGRCPSMQVADLDAWLRGRPGAGSSLGDRFPVPTNRQGEGRDGGVRGCRGRLPRAGARSSPSDRASAAGTATLGRGRRAGKAGPQAAGGAGGQAVGGPVARPAGRAGRR